MRGFFRCLIVLYFALLPLTSSAEGFRIFEKDGFFGILDATGEVAVPAVYSRLGWSDGSSQVQNGVIGFQENNLWGLITVKNKILNETKYYTLEPLGAGYIRASVKGNFSNRLFYGLLDHKGAVRISFNHFSITDLGPNWLVSDFENGRQYFGLVSFDNELLIPKRYRKVSTLSKGDLLQATGNAGHIDLYNAAGILLHRGLDSLSFERVGWKAFRDGYAGFLAPDGSLWHDLQYKDVVLRNNQPEVVDFPLWSILEGDSALLKVFCDSLTITSQNRFIAFKNGAHHLQFQDTLFEHNHELLLKDVKQNFYVVQNSKTRKWSLLSKEGATIVADYDSIFTLNQFFAFYGKKGWFLADQAGSIKNARPFENLAQGLPGQLIAKRNGYWGIVYEDLDPITPFKYDSIASLDSHYLAFYLNKVGLMDVKGEWILPATYDEIFSYQDVIVGRIQKAYNYYFDGHERLRSTARPVKWLGNCLLIESEDHLYGLINAYGEVMEPTIYESIRLFDENVVLWKDDLVQMLGPRGEKILAFSEGYQDVEMISDGFYVVRKDDRYGFIDGQGRLLISNRYEKVRSFSEGLAPVYLQKRWGFIDKQERLRIQPHYLHVSAFQDGMTIVADKNGFGLVNETGEEVIALKWENIRRLSTGNYAVENMDGKIGLVDMNGRFLLRPDFDYLEDMGQSVIVAKNGSWGILGYNGVPVIPLSHKEVRVVNNFILIRD